MDLYYRGYLKKIIIIIIIIGDGVIMTHKNIAKTEPALSLLWLLTGLINAVYCTLCRYFFCEKCYLCSHSDVMEVVDNPTRPPVYAFKILFYFLNL